jgi:hypothetical protein
MFLAYVDESYTPSTYWIAALICEESALIPLAADLDQVVAKASAAYSGISSTAELHGYPLFHGKEDWTALATMTRARIGVYAEALDAISRHPIHIVIRGVDRQKLLDRYSYPDHPHSVVLSHLLERVDECAEKHDEITLVIADEIDQADTHRQSLWYFQRHGTGGYRHRVLTRIVDTIHFAPSKSSRLVQAADLVAYLHCRMMSGNDTDERAKRANDTLWAKISPQVIHSYCWWP